MEMIAIVCVIFGAYATIWVCLAQWCLTQRAIAEHQDDTLLRVSELQAGILDAEDPTDEHESLGRRITLVPREEN